MEITRWMNNAWITICGKINSPPIDNQGLFESGQQHASTDRRRERRHKQPVITAGVHSRNGRRRISAEAVCLQPFARGRGFQVLTRLRVEFDHLEIYARSRPADYTVNQPLGTGRLEAQNDTAREHHAVLFARNAQIEFRVSAYVVSDFTAHADKRGHFHIQTPAKIEHSGRAASARRIGLSILARAAARESSKADSGGQVWRYPGDRQRLELQTGSDKKRGVAARRKHIRGIHIRVRSSNNWNFNIESRKMGVDDPVRKINLIGEAGSNSNRRDTWSPPIAIQWRQTADQHPDFILLSERRNRGQRHYKRHEDEP